MCDNKSRPLWPLLTAALIGLPVLYVLSYGAWIRLSVTGNIPKPLEWVGMVYSPVAPAVIKSPEWVQVADRNYLRLWLKGTKYEWWFREDD